MSAPCYLEGVSKHPAAAEKHPRGAPTRSGDPASEQQPRYATRTAPRARSRSRGWLTTLIAAGTFLVLAVAERRRPLRPRFDHDATGRPFESKLRREARNLAVATAGALTLQVAGAPLILPLTRTVQRRRWGLLARLGLPRPWRFVLGLLLLDYTFYLWHVMAHRVPLIWRFHLVHHTDLELDASTALRFHFGELLLGVPFQAVQVLLIGVTPSVYKLWQSAFLISILFHHSDLRIPIGWERRLSLLIVTPRMHGIHHSIVEREAESNYSSGLNLWDRLHRTLLLSVPQKDLTIGIPAYRDPWRLRLWRLLRMPFERLGSPWRFADGAPPRRDSVAGSPVSLVP